MPTYTFKKVLVISVFCLFLKPAFSQTVYSNKESSSFAFTVGLTSSNLHRDSIKNSSGILFNAGFVYTLSFSDKISAGLELLCSGKAFKKDSPVLKYRFAFIDLPLYLQYKFSESIRADIGVQYSKLAASYVSVIDGSRSGGVDTKKIETSIKDDYGILLGGEIDLTNNLSLGVRYTYSAKSFLEQKTPYFSVFQVSFKYVAFRSYKQLFHKNIDPSTK